MMRRCSFSTTETSHAQRTSLTALIRKGFRSIHPPRRQSWHREFDLIVGELAPVFKDGDETTRRIAYAAPILSFRRGQVAGFCRREVLQPVQQP
jgi:hypothetical protein